MSFFKRTWLAFLIFIILPVIALFGFGLCTNQISIQVSNEFWSSVVISISTSLLATGVVYIFIDKKLKDLLNSSDKIEVILKSLNSKPISCPVMTRREFSRSEVLGYIGMIKTVKEKERFKIESTNSQDFVDRLHKMYQTKGDQTFVVECTDEEMKQFDIGST